MKLTEAQRCALGYISGCPQKSGGFWRDLGVSPSIIAGLETAGLVTALYSAVGASRIIDRAWSITPAGRRALQEGGGDGK